MLFADVVGEYVVILGKQRVCRFFGIRLCDLLLCGLDRFDKRRVLLVGRIFIDELCRAIIQIIGAVFFIDRKLAAVYLFYGKREQRKGKVGRRIHRVVVDLDDLIAGL